MTDPKESKAHGIDRYHDMDMDADKNAQLIEIYANWADTYDQDNDAKLQTISQPLTVALLQRHLPNRDAEILDVGCGTGLVGHHLSTSGYETFDGTDISQEMLNHAKPRGYRNLSVLEPGNPLPFLNNAYDATLCVGVFTHGHLGPEGFDELIRVTKPGGILCFTVNEGVWEPEAFPEAISDRTESGVWEILEQSKQDYMINEGVQAWYIAAQKCN